MRLLLIRHGETIHNVSGILAGTTDSPLTNHGILQATRLATFLVANGVHISHVFSSDLQRAYVTASTIRSFQPIPPSHTKCPLIREQHMGQLEGTKYINKDKAFADGDAKDAVYNHNPMNVESGDSMRARSEEFVKQYLERLLLEAPAENTVAVVAHGIILGYIWRALLSRFPPRNVAIGPNVQTSERGLEYLGAWSNTGYLDLEIKPISVAAISNAINSPVPTTGLSTISLVVKAVNRRDHLTGLKRTGGGIGSQRHDNKQKTMDSFFKTAGS